MTPKILTNVYYAIIYPFLIYGITIWGNANRTLIQSLHTLQKKIVRLITYNDDSFYIKGPLPHSAPLFYQVKLLHIYDIFKLQVAKIVYESEHNIGPCNKILNYNKVSEMHNHNTRYSYYGGIYMNSVRTSKYGIKSLRNEGRLVWESIPDDIKKSTSKKMLVSGYKKHLVNSYI